MGFNLWESDDPLAAAKEGLLWSDLIDLKVYPVVDDATDVTPIFRSHLELE